MLSDAGWALPVSLTRADRLPPVTRVGAFDPIGFNSVDERGLVSIDAAGRSPQPPWSLDWWVGADDRWHLPSRDAAVRQRLVGGAPVVETVMRIPGGDALHRVYGARGPAFPGGDEYLVVEVENASSVPFALALVVRPFTADRIATIDRITMQPTAGGRARQTAQMVSLNGVPAVLLPAAPARSATGSAATGDVAERVTTGVADAGFPGATDVDGVATAALLFPVSHTAVLRIALPVGADRPRHPDDSVALPSDLPDAARVARGWAVQTRRCPRSEVPDTGLSQGIEATQRTLLLEAGATERGRRGSRVATTAGLARALDRENLHDEAARILAGWPDRLAGTRLEPADASAVVAAAVDHWRLTRDLALVEALLPELVAAVRALERDTSRGAPMAGDALAGLAEVLTDLDQPDAARRVADIATNADSGSGTAAGAGPRPASPALWGELSRVVSAASPAWSWPGTIVDQPERFLSTVRGLLVGESAEGLAVLPAGMGPWYRQPVALHGAPTRWGRFSFALRWHGTRPALLWELDRHGSTAVTIAAPALDPVWSTTEPKGEALLAPVSVPAEVPAEVQGLPPAGPGGAGLGGAGTVAPRSVLPMAPDESCRDDDERARSGARRSDRQPPPDDPGASFT